MKKILTFIAKKSSLILALIVITGGGWFLFLRPKQKEAATTIVQRQTLKETVIASGQIKASHSANLHFLNPGRLAWLPIKKGDQVKKWQAIGSLDQRQLEKQLRQKLLDYQTSRWNFEQSHQDYQASGLFLNQIALTDEEKRILEKTQFSLDRAVLDVEIAQLVKKDSLLISPIKGTVVEVKEIFPGMNLTSANLGQHYIRVVDLTTLYFEAKVDELDYGKIEVGQEVLLTIDAFPETEFSGKVVFIGKEGQKTIGEVINIPVDIKLDEYNEPFVPEINGEAQFIIGQRENVLAIPREYLFLEDNQNFVWKRKKNQRKKTEVKTGRSSAEYQEILEGLAEGDEIILLSQ